MTPSSHLSKIQNEKMDSAVLVPKLCFEFVPYTTHIK